jgi:hypothetical protein
VCDPISNDVSRDDILAVIHPRKETDYECVGCHKCFATSSNLGRHTKTCKKANAVSMEATIASLTAQVQRLSEVIQHQSTTTASASGGAGDRSPGMLALGTNCTNTFNDNSVHVTVMLKFGEEDMSHISKQEINEHCQQPLELLQKLIDKTHFSPDKPRNQTVRCVDPPHGPLEVSDGKGKWKECTDREKVLYKIISRLFNFMNDKCSRHLCSIVQEECEKFNLGEDAELVANVLRETFETIIKGQEAMGIPA